MREVEHVNEDVEDLTNAIIDICDTFYKDLLDKTLELQKLKTELKEIRRWNASQSTQLPIS